MSDFRDVVNTPLLYKAWLDTTGTLCPVCRAQKRLMYADLLEEKLDQEGTAKVYRDIAEMEMTEGLFYGAKSLCEKHRRGDVSPPSAE